MKYATKKSAREVIDQYKDETNYFCGNLNMKDMKEMFIYRMNFGEAETNVIISALVLSGAKFKI